MATTIVFACKSNSCRSQMAEGWAHAWIKEQRVGVDNRRIQSEEQQPDEDRQLGAFLDGLLVTSVALDESSVPKPKTPTSTADQRSSSSSFSSAEPTLGASPASSIIAEFEEASSSGRQCVTCNGETCTSDGRRKKPKEKAIRAMAQDGVDISSYFAKTFGEVLPFVMSNHRRQHDENNGCDGGNDGDDDDNNLNNSISWKRYLSFSGVYQVLEMASREMGMAHAGVAREERSNNNISESESSSSSMNTALSSAHDNNNTQQQQQEVLQVVDNLIVLCSVPNSMKRQLSDVSKVTMDWDIDPPTAAAKSGEGDGAYVRVSRQIRGKVHDFLNELKGCALMVAVVDGNNNAVDGLTDGLTERSKICDGTPAALAVAVPS